MVAEGLSHGVGYLAYRGPRARRFDGELCLLFGVPPSVLPEVCPSAGRLGETLGVPGLPEVRPGDDIAGLIARAVPDLADGDILVVTSKIVSKAEGRIRRAADRTEAIREEAARVVRTRVLNPKWIGAMCRHGYKGAFEMAATVDYLFGYDATTGVLADWMYDKLTETYVLDPANREFLQEANPWALHGIAERLLEAESRGMWEKPDPSILAALRQAYLETEGNLEGDD